MTILNASHRYLEPPAEPRKLKRFLAFEQTDAEEGSGYWYVMDRAGYRWSIDLLTKKRAQALARVLNEADRYRAKVVTRYWRKQRDKECQS